MGSGSGVRDRSASSIVSDSVTGNPRISVCGITAPISDMVRILVVASWTMLIACRGSRRIRWGRRGDLRPKLAGRSNRQVVDIISIGTSDVPYAIYERGSSASVGILTVRPLSRISSTIKKPWLTIVTALAFLRGWGGVRHVSVYDPICPSYRLGCHHFLKKSSNKEKIIQRKK